MNSLWCILASCHTWLASEEWNLPIKPLYISMHQIHNENKLVTVVDLTQLIVSKIDITTSIISVQVRDGVSYSWA